MNNLLTTKCEICKHYFTKQTSHKSNVCVLCRNSRSVVEKLIKQRKSIAINIGNDLYYPIFIELNEVSEFLLATLSAGNKIAYVQYNVISIGQITSIWTQKKELWVKVIPHNTKNASSIMFNEVKVSWQEVLCQFCLINP